jgi:hypothetical protein
MQAWVQYYKTFLRPYFTNFRNKLECLSLTILTSLVYCLWVRPEPTQVKCYLATPVYGRLLLLPANIGLGWKGMPGTYKHSSLLRKFVLRTKKFYNIGPDVNVYKTLFFLRH